MQITSLLILSLTSLACQVHAAPAPLPNNDILSIRGPADKPYLQNLEVFYQEPSGFERLGSIVANDSPALTALYPHDVNVAYAERHWSEFKNDADINKGFSGWYVFLQPVWTADINKAVTTIRTWHQRSPKPGFDDLARGSGGDYRYYQCSRVEGQKAITKVALYRSRGKYPGPLTNYGYKWATGDINEGRGGDYLHIVFGAP